MNSKTPLLNILDLPNITLKKLDPSKNIGDTVDIFNYNFEQLLDYYQSLYSLGLSEIEIEEPIPGLSIKGDKGDKGTSVYAVNSIINNGYPVPLPYQVGDVFLDNGGSVFEAKIVSNVLVYSFIYALANNGGSSYFKKESVVTNTAVNHGFIKWDDPGNDSDGNISAFEEENGFIRYYRTIFGDWKRSPVINSTATFTNILEAKKGDPNSLTNDASSLAISNDFAQIAIQYRHSFDAEPILETVYHKFYRGIGYNSNQVNNIYSISNGGSAVVMHSNKSVRKWELGGFPNGTDQNSAGDIISGNTQLEIKADSVSLFNDSWQLYQNAESIHFQYNSPSANSVSSTNRLYLWMGLSVKGDFLTNRISDLQGNSWMSGGMWDYNRLISAGLDTALVAVGFVKDSNYVHTDNNLTNVLKNLIVKTDWNAIAGSNAELLNKPALFASTNFDPVNPQTLQFKDSAGGIISQIALPTGISVKNGLALLSNQVAGNYAFNSNYNYADVYHPVGKTSADVIGVISSFSYLGFYGKVDDNDVLWLKHTIHFNRVKFYANNSENDGDTVIQYLIIYK